MADAQTTRKLLLKYFNNAPREEVENYLGIMYAALSSAQKTSLKSAAKDFLLVNAENELVAASGTLGTLESLYNVKSVELNTVITKIVTDIEEISSLDGVDGASQEALPR